MEILNGKALSAQIKEEIAQEVSYLLSNMDRPPHLAAVLVGDNPASKAYVGSKVRSCEKVGFSSTLIERPSNISQNELLEIVIDLNNDERIDGFIVQLPLPEHLDAAEILLAIDPSKDVDGFHPFNFGCMAQGLDSFVPATPLGIMKMLERYEIETAGKNVVVLGRSNIVGTPMSILLSRKSYPGNATVTLAHSRTKDLADVTRRADIIIVALGKAEFLKADMVKEGVVVVDVGINRVTDESRVKGYRLVGDVAFDEVSSKCSYITPVPGGVGPMTVTSLLLNTLKSYKKRFNIDS